MNHGDFHGRDTIVLANEYFQLECLAEAGPRVVRLIPAWLGENIFAETPEAITPTQYGDFHYLGGHRFAIAPESLERTYIPEDAGVTIKKIAHGIKLIGSLQPDTHIRKTISVEISPNQPFAMIKHNIENLGRAPVELSPWAITMMRTQGTAILPQHYGTVDKDGVLPNRNLALWAYSRWDDPRLKLGDDFISVRASGLTAPFKLGHFNTHGWLGYLFEDVFFVKRFGTRRSERYPDFGCNAEVYTNDRTVELESLGALVTLEPGDEIAHTETWEVYETNNIPGDFFDGRNINEILE